MSRLRISGVYKNFGGVIALNGADLTVESGSICGLLGANGSGKTTLSRVISGMIKADAGEILFDGEKIELTSTKQAMDLGIVMAHQNLSLVEDLTVWENICLGKERMKGLYVDNKECMRYANEILEEFQIAYILMEKIRDLTPSQRQLVEVCKAFAANPKLLILDEPTAALEFMQVGLLFKAIGRLKESGVSIVFITHRMDEITRYCDTVAILRNGESVGTLDLTTVDEDKQREIILQAITGKEMAQKSDEQRNRKPGEALLKLENVGFKGILHDISFELRSGEIVGICGLQGMGQEELMSLLAGFFQRTEGKIFYKGKKVSWRSPKQAVQNGVFLVPGDRHKEGLFLTYSVLDNLFYPQFAKKRSSFLLSIKALKKSAIGLMDTISLIPRDAGAKLMALSGGNQQKVVLGKWLNQKPELLLMSDPAKGIDVEARSDLYRICKGIADEGKAIILYASDNDELIDMCDRVYVVFEGRIVACIEKNELCDSRLTEAALHSQTDKGESA